MGAPEKNRTAKDMLRTLQPLMGTWVGEETLAKTSMTPAGLAWGTWSFKSGLGGTYIFIDYAEDGGLDMHGHGVIGFDVDRDLFTLHWFDNFGSPPHEPGHGEWLEHELAFRHGDHGRTIFGIAEDGSLTCRIEMNLDGNGFKPVLSGTYRRPRPAADFAHV